jgi:hypothetical protein
MLLIDRTSSHGAAGEDKILCEDGILRTRQVLLSERTWGNFLCYGVYRIYKVFYATIYFYFIPYLAIIGSFAVPMVIPCPAS